MRYLSGQEGDGGADCMKVRRLLFLAFGHMTSDLYPGMLSPLLPLLLQRYGLSMAMAGVLIMVLQVFSNLSQPIVGFINDNKPMKSFLWLGLLVSAVPFCCLFYLNGIEMIILALAVSGIGVGMYHPVAVVAAGKIAQEKRSGITMALFSSGGSFGFMIAPLFVVVIVKILGEPFMPLVIIPALIMTVLFLSDSDIVVATRNHTSVREWFAALAEERRELFILWLVATFRAIVSMNVGAFLPILAIARGASYVTSAYFLSGSLLAAMIGMILGGHLSDIHGRRKIMAITLLISSPLLFIFLFTGGVVSTVALLLGMGALSSTIPVNIFLAQRAAPKHASIASSFVMGMPFAVAALVAPMFGALADRIGIETAMYVMVAIPLFGGLAVFFLRQE